MSEQGTTKPHPGWEIVKLLIPVVMTSLITFGVFFYNNYLVRPKVEYKSVQGQDYFTAQEGYRGMRVRLRAQVVVKYRNHVVASVYVNGYYKNEHVTFKSKEGFKEGVAEQADPGMTAELLFYTKESILDSLEEAYGEGVLQEDDLDVHISILGGMTYENKRGNGDKEYCFIAEEGSVLDYDRGSWVIDERLREYEIGLPGDVESMERDKEIETLIQDVSTHIGENLLGKEEKDTGLLRNIVVVAVVVVAVAAGYELWLWRRWIANTLKRRFPRLYRHAPLLKLAFVIAAVCITPRLTILAVHAIAPTRDESLVYDRLDNARQKPDSILFIVKQPKEPVPSVEPESWPAQAVMNRLHIPKKFVGIKINEVTLGYYDGLFEGIYQNGTNNMPESAILPDWFGLENEPYASLGQAAAGLPEEERAGTVYGVIEREADKWPISRRPAALYHVSRVLTDTVLNHPELDFETLFDIAADGVALGEKFLSYRNRNIEEREKDILNGEDTVPDAESVMNAEDIALKNGKVYWALANDVEVLETLQKYKGYAPCLWAAGYKCMEWGRKQAAEDDPQYAKMTYYLGNLGERMLPYVSQELYEKVGTAALGYYYEARKLLDEDKGGGIYLREENMADNIQSGIDTLEGMGFVYEPEEQ